jgi:hypothetical protein
MAGGNREETAMFNITIRRCQGNQNAWAAVLPSGWLVATSYDIQALIDLVYMRHGPTNISIDVR